MKGLISLVMIICGSWTLMENNLAIAKPVAQSNLIIVQNSEGSGDVRLTQEGTGTYSINNRFRGTITFVSVSIDDNGEAELIFRNSNEQLVRFQGQVTRRDPYGIKIDLIDSDISDASGVADIQYSSDLSFIYSIFVAGTIKNQIFSINFSR
ncbi:hypothetical protein M595_4096 [Lyngbya aestuarii BL J]|uniref:Uncharacterized protein n=1 Tax=Lyngbya aestuarii BL J TaxID=1348334 RepID=U7QHS2_9CYAN|nr:hypothetical protein [Lyngbya aestuarii]ERT05966.1 hypothetical protein M595_4096 [Lyngbya aestuarii BL J]